MLITREELALHKVTVDKTYPAGAIDYPKFRQTGPLQVQAVAELAEGEIHIRGHLDARVEAECDRCIVLVEVPVAQDFDLYYRPVASIAREEEIEISGDELDVGFYSGTGVELADLIREQVILALPMKVICQPDCKGLCPGCGVNLNEEMCRCRRPTSTSPFTSLRES